MSQSIKVSLFSFFPSSQGRHVSVWRCTAERSAAHHAVKAHNSSSLVRSLSSVQPRSKTNDNTCWYELDVTRPGDNARRSSALEISDDWNFEIVRRTKPARWPRQTPPFFRPALSAGLHAELRSFICDCSKRQREEKEWKEEEKDNAILRSVVGFKVYCKGEELQPFFTTQNDSALTSNP